MKFLYFASTVLLLSWFFIGWYFSRNQIKTITLPAFEVEHDGKEVIKMGWE